MSIDVNDSINTNAMFPNLDQMSESSRNIYVKDHEFQQAVSEMIAELNRLLSAESGSSVIASGKSKVSEAINRQLSEIETVRSAVEGPTGYISQMETQLVEVQAAYERLLSKIRGDIESININVNNRTGVFDSIGSYGDRLINKIDSVIGKTSPLKDGRSDPLSTSDKYTIVSPTHVALRETEHTGYKTIPVIIQPNLLNELGEDVTQLTPIKICEFTPVINGTSVPSFMAQIIVSGDLFNFKGIMSSGNKDANTRGVNFDAEYMINQDLPFAIKALYDEERNRIAIVFKFDETDDKFTSIVKFDFSIDLIVGTDLTFAEPGTQVKNIHN